jgi:predicted nucleic acid-binding Zn finger protein
MLSEVQFDLLNSFQARFSSLPDSADSQVQVLKAVNFALFDHRKLLESAIEVLGDDVHAPKIKSYKCVSCERFCWKVRGSHDKEYTCLEKFCSCPHFFNQCKVTQGRVICKHLLAIKIQCMLRPFQFESVSDERFIELICSDSTSTDSTASVAGFKPYRSWRSKH